MRKILRVLILSILIFLMSACSKDTVTESKSTSSVTAESTVTAEETTVSEETTTKEMVDGREVISSSEMNTFSTLYMNLYGRTYFTDGNLVLDHNATGFELWFYGTTFYANISTASTLYIRYFVDDDTEGTVLKIVRNKKYIFFNDLEEGTHKIKVVKATSTYGGELTFHSIGTDGKFLSKDDESSKLNIEFIGDSISCGAGVLTTNAHTNDFSNSDVTKAYSYMTAMELNMNPSIVSCCGICVSGKVTLNVSMLEMYPWYSLNNAGKYDFKTKMDYCVIALGTNDNWYMSTNANYGISELAKDYQSLIEMVRSNNPDAYIICVYGFMNQSENVISAINTAIEAVNDSKVSYLNVPTDNSGGDSHPGLEGAVKQKDALVAYIKTLMNK